MELLTNDGILVQIFMQYSVGIILLASFTIGILQISYFQNNYSTNSHVKDGIGLDFYAILFL
jgi:hypothetical protein